MILREFKDIIVSLIILDFIIYLIYPEIDKIFLIYIPMLIVFLICIFNIIKLSLEIKSMEKEEEEFNERSKKK